MMRLPKIIRNRAWSLNGFEKEVLKPPPNRDVRDGADGRRYEVVRKPHISSYGHVYFMTRVRDVSSH